MAKTLEVGLPCIPPERGCDDYGCGHYGAPRGSRDHNGRDVACYPGTLIGPIISGRVTKLGWVSKKPGKEHFRYVQVTDDDDLNHRYMYVEPLVNVGEYVNRSDVIGRVQDIAGFHENRKEDKEKHKRMKNHVHYEIEMQDGTHIDPTPFLKGEHKT